jgi:hypothetical protein
MSDLSHRLQQEYEKLKTHRDELRVQLDLGKKEAKAAWLEVDETWGELETRMKLLGRLSRQTAEEVSEAAGELVDDAREGVSLTADEVKDGANKLVGEVREGLARLRSLI